MPTGGYLEQADGTAWMSFFTQNMAELAVEIAVHDPTYVDLAFKFIEHFLYIAAGINKPGEDGMWDEEDGFYYDLLRLPDGSATRLKVRSMVGLLPLCATTVIEKWQRERVPETLASFMTRIRQMPELLESIHPTGPGHFGVPERGIFALVNPERLRRILSKMLDENEISEPLRHPLALQVPRTAPVCVLCGRPGVPRELSAGRIEHQHVRRQLQLAGAGLDAG